MGFNGEKYWSCPKCGSTTETEANERVCTNCDWSTELPQSQDGSGE